MLLVVHNSLGEIRLYQLKIESNPTALTIRRVALLRGLIVQSPTDEQRIEVPSGHSALTSLQLVPAKIDPKAPSLPKIIAVTTRISYDFQGSDTAETVIHSLQITADDAVTHAAFNALGPNPASSKNPGSSKVGVFCAPIFRVDAEARHSLCVSSSQQKSPCPKPS